MTTPELRLLSDPSRPAWDGSGDRPIRVHLWRPTSATDAPPNLVVLSHGTGGAAQNLTWLATELAGAGLLVAAVDHHGNTFVDKYQAQAFACWWDRPLDLTYLIDQLTATERIGTVGAAGFSLGGYTVAALLGARAVPEIFAALALGEVPTPPTPEYPGLVAELQETVTEAQFREWLPAVGGDYTDPRIRAGLLICPSLGPMLDPASLTAISRPTRIWTAEADQIVPADQVARYYAESIPTASLRRTTGGVGHYAFLDSDETGAAVRTQVAADAVEFFQHTLGHR